MKFPHQVCQFVPAVVLVCGLLSVPAQAQFFQQGPKLVGTGAVASPFVHQGISVSASGDGNTAIVGGNNDNNFVGAAWVFTRSGGVWSQQAKLVGTGAVGAAFQGFSVSLSSDGSTAMVGGPDDDGQIGAAWVFAPFAGTPGTASCVGLSTQTLAREFGGLNAAAAGTGFSSISALQGAVLGYCDGSGQASTLP